MAAGVERADNESAVKTAPPPIDCRAVNRLLEQCARPSGPAPEARPRARDRLEAILGGELGTVAETLQLLAQATGAEQKPV